MNTKTLVSLALLVGIGAVLHAIMPPFFLGMKPDMLLTMMFLGIFLFPDKKNVTVLAIATGIVSALTTTFPGGQIANIIDKIVTAFVIFALFLLLKKVGRSIITAAILTAIGTLISGGVFLTAALVLVGLPGGFLALYGAVVLPATVVNTIMMIIIYPIVTSILKRAKIDISING